MGASSSSNQVQSLTMKPLPKNDCELNAEAASLGLLSPNAKADNPRKTLIGHLWNSKKIGRSTRQGSILLVGSSGVGKSSTINHLFNLKEGVTFAKTSDHKSETRVTTEYIIQSDYPDYDVKDLELGIVDSPGFNDTDGIKQDACNFYSIKKFYANNEKLRGCYPNLIFLLVQATDTRLSGSNSNLGKSLKCLDKLKLVDKQHPNVVGILTWSCSVPGKGIKWEQKIKAKKEALQNIIFQLLHVKAPIVAIENAFEDNELDIVDDYSRLPDGQLQPSNIYNACKGLLLESKDPLGLVILNACFQKAKNLVVGFQVDVKDANKSKLSAEEEMFFKNFVKATQGGIEDPIISNADNFIQREKLSQEAADEIQMCVGKIKKLGVQDPEELKYIRSGNINEPENLISDISKKFLEEELKVKSSPVAIGSCRVLGQGFNIKNDKVVPSQILEIDTVDSGYGVLIPLMAKFEPVIESRCYMDAFEDSIAMTKSRINQLNIGVDVEYKIFEFTARAGSTIKGSSTTDKSAYEASYLHEERLFELKMANFHDDRMKFTKDFVSAVEKLPKTYRKDDPEIIHLYEHFFDRWGQFMVVGAFGGGSVESKISSQMIAGDHMSFDQIKISMAAAFNGGITKVSGSTDYSQETNIAIKSKCTLDASTFKWIGGDRSLHSKSTIEDPDSMRKWKLSLMDNPTILETEMHLEPISTIVGCINQHKEAHTYSAIKDCLGGEFRFFKNKEAAAKEELRRKQAEAERIQRENENTVRTDTIEKPPESGSCFPSSAKVTVLQGNKLSERNMNMLSEGDLVMSYNMKSKDIIFSPVIMFAHFNKLSKAEYISLILENGKEITLSRNHLLLVGKEEKIIMAEDVKQGDIIFNNKGGKIEVVEIKQVFESGIFAPITYGGTIFVNNILTSCYASVNDYVFFNGAYTMTGHNLAHLGLLPMRIWYKSFAKKKLNEKAKVIDRHISEIHPYIRWLIKIELPWMAK